MKQETHINDALILVVDDDEINRFTLSRRLVKEGFSNIREAVNGREALDMLSRERFHLILLDVMMPELDGYQVLEAMQADSAIRDIPVIIVSALSEEASAIKCIELGAVDYLFKPVNPVLLRARMRACLDRQRLQMELFSALTEFRTMLEISPLAIALLKGAVFDWVNPAMAKLTGRSMTDLEGMELVELFDDQQEYYTVANRFNRALSLGESYSAEISLRREDNTTVWVSVSAKALNLQHLEDGLIIIGEDITEKRIDRERINFLAYHDVLTGLPNRMLMVDRLQQALASAARNNTRVALFFLDLDRFKEVNDTLGHEVGDQLLNQVALRLRNCIRETDTVARFGGDEFLVVLPNISSVKDVETVARKIKVALADPFELGRHVVNISGSIGISLYYDHAEDIDTLMKYADIAMYRAKQKGGNNYLFYEEGTHDDVKLPERSYQCLDEE